MFDEAIARRQPALHRVATITPGVRNLYSTRGPIRTPGDMEGLRMRVMASPIDEMAWKAVGAETHRMPFGAIEGAMRSGRIEVAEDTAAVYHAQRHYELAPHLSLTRHQWSLGFVLMNRAVWEGLPPAARNGLSACGSAMTRAVVDYAVRSAESAIDALRCLPGAHVTEPERDAFRVRFTDLRGEVARKLSMEDMLALVERLA
jgi:TRAP-type transport system periplasmic protein